MIIASFLAGALILAAPAHRTISFQPINPDSVVSVWPSSIGYTSRSTSAIYANLKNGDSALILYDKGARISPVAELSPNKRWLTAGNLYWDKDKNSCEGLLCSLPKGLCKCADVIADSDFTFNRIPDSEQGGCELLSLTKWAKPPSSQKKKERKRHLTKMISEEEMQKRFDTDFNKSVHMD